jgi:hypothetical protein
LDEPGFDELLARLVEAEVRFVVIGGLALGAWGVIRATKDCDIVPDPDPANLDRLAALSVALGGHVQRSDALLGSEGSIAALLREGERTRIVTRLGALDVVQNLAGVPPYDELRPAAREAEFEGVKVAVCSVGHLRAMKRKAARPRDLVDLSDLNEAQPES